MKKVFCILTCSLFTLFLTGCGTKTLTCTKTSTEAGMVSKENIKINFKNDKPSTSEMSVEMSFDEDTKAYANMIFGMLESTFENYEQDGLNVDINKTDDSIKLKMNVDFSKVKDIDELDINIDLDEDYNDVKEDYLEEGYNCK